MTHLINGKIIIIHLNLVHTVNNFQKFGFMLEKEISQFVDKSYLI